jgi:type 1 glutamine amidotransferase
MMHRFRRGLLGAGLPLILACSAFALSQGLRPRSQAEAILGPAADTAGPFPPLNIVLVWGVKDHNPGEHEYELFARQWQGLLGRMHNTAVSLAYYWPSAAQWRDADLIVFHLRTHNCLSNTGQTCAPKQDTAIIVGPAQFAQLDDFLARGKGVVAIHAGNYPHQMYQDAWADRFGLAWKAGANAAATTTYRTGDVALAFRKATGHPILAGLPDTLHFDDEMYFPLFGHPEGVTELAASTESFQGQSAPRTALWTYSPPGKPGRVYGFLMGHYQSSFGDPVFRILLLRGMAWAAGEGFARFRRVVLDSAAYRDDATALGPGPRPPRPGPSEAPPAFLWKGERSDAEGRHRPSRVSPR